MKQTIEVKIFVGFLLAPRTHSNNNTKKVSQKESVKPCTTRLLDGTACYGETLYY